MSILVTGGLGFIGSSVIRYLITKEFDSIINLDNENISIEDVNSLVRNDSDLDINENEINLDSDVKDLSCNEVIIDDNVNNDFDENRIEVLEDDVNLVGGSQVLSNSDSDSKKTIDLIGIKGGKKFMTRRERDNLRGSNNNNFSFFDS